MLLQNLLNIEQLTLHILAHIAKYKNIISVFNISILLRIFQNLILRISKINFCKCKYHKIKFCEYEGAYVKKLANYSQICYIPTNTFWFIISRSSYVYVSVLFDRMIIFIEIFFFYHKLCLKMFYTEPLLVVPLTQMFKIR